ncbi:MAG: excinuclease ABC subunit UvrA [Candidatus Delongbacteria bacterium]|nr:excinuclease ABC subunit UvrA [Candidatus Delongbacteria bacterium]
MRTSDKLIIKGANEHNLKNIDLELEKNKLIVFTGISGSGKSSMAFDTIYTEGQRRYVESLSNYTKQFLGIMKKPVVDSIEGLSPAISIEQKTSSSNPRSTVGTVTEIFDFVRMLFARAGHQYCYSCENEVHSRALDEIIGDILKSLEENTKFIIISPYIERQKGNLKNSLDFLRAEGFFRVIIDEKEYTLDDEINVDEKKFHKLYVIVDRLKKRDDIKSRLAESVEIALKLSGGNLIIDDLDKKEQKLYSEKNYCQKCHISYPDLSPNSFSFNTPAGMCSDCHGLGFIKTVDINKLVKYPKKSISQGAIPYVMGQNIEFKKIRSIFKAYDVDFNTPVNKIPEKLFKAIMYGTSKTLSMDYVSKSFQGVITTSYEGLSNLIERRYRETSSNMARHYYESFMMDSCCVSCEGKRLKKESLAVKVHGHSIDQITSMEINKLTEFVKDLPGHLTEKENEIIKELQKEMCERLNFLMNVGLQYLTLDRNARTLSGGEAQRIRLASQIASGLTGVIYVLDEPSIGLHQKDNKKLLDNLIELKNKGNTVIVVEHDRETIEAAETIVDFGKEAGVYGGDIVYRGDYKNLEKNRSHTSDYVFRRENVNIENKSNENSGEIVLSKVSTNNLKDINVSFPLNKMTVVTGVSGAGKSSLVMDTLYPALKSMAKNKEDLKDPASKIEANYNDIYIKDTFGKKFNDFEVRLIKIDQNPIGRTPRSNPVTYIGAFDTIREIMAKSKLARMRGYTKSRFSFNVKGGRCEKCQGSGVIKIEMHFLADVYVECDVCNGKRYNSETLEVTFKDKNINEILNLDVQEAYELFKNIPALKNKLGTLMSVGMGYVKLGQPSTTLSGGEAQRIKLAKELSRAKIQGTVYILDEPTTGLHFLDIQHLLNVLKELRDSGSTVIIIEHNLDVIVNCDHVIDLGPDGGPTGGKLVFQGSVEEIAKSKKGYTAKEVRKELKARG